MSEVTPLGSDGKVSCAMPPTSGALPRTVAPFKNVTMPVAGPTAGAKTFTVAVKVAGALPAIAKVVLVMPGCTTWVNVGLVAVAFDASPAYVAIIKALPTGRLLTGKIAVRVLPVPFKLALPSNAAPEKKLTLPVGAIPVTVAVKVVVCPKALGLTELVNTTPAIAGAIVCANGPQVVFWKPAAPVKLALMVLAPAAG